MTNGVVGFVLPFKKNIIYIELNDGDNFGEIDLNVAAVTHDISVIDMIEQ